MIVERIPLTEFHARLKSQGVSSREHSAVKCPICGTVQSIASLIGAGDVPEFAENHIGFSCEGRISKAGPWPAEKDESKAAKARRLVRGCDWSLGGLFQLHQMVVVMNDGSEIPVFAPATAEEAQELERAITHRKATA